MIYPVACNEPSRREAALLREWAKDLAVEVGGEDDGEDVEAF